MSNPYRIAIIGCGQIAKYHLDAMRHIEDLKPVATVDIVEERAKRYAEMYGAEKHYTSYVEAIEEADIDAVIICLPHNLHFEVAIKAAEKNKHIMVEKPLAISLEEAERMVKAAEGRNLILMVEQTLRFRRCNRKVKELIEKGVIGEPRNIIRRRFRYSKKAPISWADKPEVTGGFLLFGIGSHEVDVTLWHLNQRARKVYAQGTINNPYWRDYDEISIQMELSNNAIATVILSLNSQHTFWDSTIIGTEGTITVREAVDVKVGEQIIQTPLSREEGIEAALREFASAMRNRREPESSGRDVLRTMWTLEAARLSLKEGKVIGTERLRYPL